MVTDAAPRGRSALRRSACRAVARRAREPPSGWTASAPAAKAWGRSDTVYLAATDADGNAVSFINSVYDDFGSGHVAEGLGFVMQNRGAGFSLDPAHPNRLAAGQASVPHDHSGHGAARRRLHAAFGVSGGLMQPQGHLQLLVSLLDYGLDVQSAVDAPRFWWEEGRRVVIESGVPRRDLRDAVPSGATTSCAASIAAWAARRSSRRCANGVWVAGSEPRQDGCAIGY